MKEKTKKYKIKEKWIVDGESEYYTTIADTLEKVKKYIEDWIEGWKESCEENEYKIEKYETDYKTFAKVVIKKPYKADIMKLIVEEI
jgi:predicted RNase H-like HicB family nuclease